MTITLALPAETAESVTPPAVTAPYVHGYVFIDANQNGQRDTDEKGLASVPVTVKPQAGAYSENATTLADGSYWLDDLDPGTYDLEIAAPDGYTSTFTVKVPPEDVEEDPVESPNAIPAAVTLDAKGATAVTPESYLAQILPEPPVTPRPLTCPITMRMTTGWSRRSTSASCARTKPGWATVFAISRAELSVALGSVLNGQLIVDHVAEPGRPGG